MSIHILKILSGTLDPGAHRPPAPCTLRSGFRQAWEESLGTDALRAPSQETPRRRDTQEIESRHPAEAQAAMTAVAAPESPSHAPVSTKTTESPDEHAVASQPSNREQEEPAPSMQPTAGEETPSTFSINSELLGTDFVPSQTELRSSAAPSSHDDPKSGQGSALVVNDGNCLDNPVCDEPASRRREKTGDTPPGQGYPRASPSSTDGTSSQGRPSRLDSGATQFALLPNLPQSPAAEESDPSGLPPRHFHSGTDLGQHPGQTISLIQHPPSHGESPATDAFQEHSPTTFGPSMPGASPRSKLADDQRLKSRMFLRLANRETRSAGPSRAVKGVGSPEAGVLPEKNLGLLGRTSLPGVLDTGTPQPSAPIVGPQAQGTSPPAAETQSTANVVSALSFGPRQPIMDVAYSAGTHEGASAALSASSSDSADLDPVPMADRWRFIHRVAQAFVAGARRDGIIRLKLHPPELGTLRMQIRVKDGRLEARLEAERPEVCALLTDGLDSLRQRLENYQLRVEKFEVALAKNDSSSSEQGAAGQPPRPEEHARWAPAYHRPTPEVPPASEAPIAGVIDTTRVDVRV